MIKYEIAKKWLERQGIPISKKRLEGDLIVFDVLAFNDVEGKEFPQLPFGWKMTNNLAGIAYGMFETEEEIKRFLKN